MNRNMADATGGRKDEDTKAGLIKITPIALGGGEKAAKGFKKGGFKSAFGNVDSEKAQEEVKTVVVQPAVKGDVDVVDEQESETEDEGYERYDPHRPTDCGMQCKGRR